MTAGDESRQLLTCLVHSLRVSVWHMRDQEKICNTEVMVCRGHCNGVYLMLAGAAAFAAMRAYEQHQAANGRPPQHQLAKEILAGFVGAEVSACSHRTSKEQTQQVS